MTYLKSKYFLRPLVLNCTVGILAIFDIFLSKYIPQEIRQAVGIVFACIYFILFIWATFYLFFKSFDEWDIENQIKNLEEDREKKLKYSDNFDKEELHFKYKKVQEEIPDKNFFCPFH